MAAQDGLSNGNYLFWFGFFFFFLVQDTSPSQEFLLNKDSGSCTISNINQFTFFRFV